MPEAVFLSIRRRPANEAGATVRGYVVAGPRIVIPSPAVVAQPGVSIAEAFRLVGIQRETR